MDDKNDRGYSRAPTLDDILGLCQALNDNEISYILIGGIAVIIHGFPRGTKDVDLLVDPDEKNIEKIKKALSYLPDNAIAEIKNDEVKKYSVVRIGDEIIIDLLEKACGVTYEEASKDIIKIEIDGVIIPLASPQLLIRMKDTVRPTDKKDVEFLQSLLKKNRNKL